MHTLLPRSVHMTAAAHFMSTATSASTRRGRSIRPADVLLLEQPPDVPADREQEDERLLAVHQDPAEVLVRIGERPQSRGVVS